MLDLDLESLPTSQISAKHLGVKHYFTGEECSRGHVSARLASSRVCIECRRENDRNPNDKRRKYLQEYERSKKCKERRQAYAKSEKGKEKRRETERKNYYKNIDSSRAKAVEKYHNMTPEQKARMYKTRARKRKSDPSVKMADKCRQWVGRVLNFAGKEKLIKAEQYLGYTRDDLVAHLEKQFDKKMTWNNYGDYWEIDHITPIHHFLSEGVTDPAQINCLSNLRPLTVRKNRTKKHKLELLV